MAVVGNLMSDAALEGHYLTHPEPCGVCSKRISSITVVLIKPFAIVDLLHSCHNLFLWISLSVWGFLCSLFFETSSHCVALVALELRFASLFLKVLGP